MRLNKSTVSAVIILVALATIIGLSGLSFIIPSETRKAPDNREDNQRESASMEKIFFTTKDGVKIAANLYSVKPTRGWLVLAHMMPATKESYRDLAQRFQNLGYECLAIDLRGHGESIIEKSGNGEERRLNYLNFSDEEHQKSILDLEAAVDYLIQNRRASVGKISFIGASIGANLSLQYISGHSEFRTAVLLSPGLNYKGIKIEPMVKKLKAGQKVLFISSRDDGPNAEQNQELYDLTPDGTIKNIQIYEIGGHGTDILGNQPSSINLIVDFIK